MVDKLKAVPEFKKYPITVLNDETEKETVQTFKFYVKGAGTPVPVVIEVGNAYIDYEEDWPTEEQIAEHNAVWQLHRTRRAELLLRRNLLQAISPDLTLGAANLLAAQDGDGITILSDCGWYSVAIAIPESEEEETDEDGQGKVESGESTSLTLLPAGQE